MTSNRNLIPGLSCGGLEASNNDVRRRRKKMSDDEVFRPPTGNFRVPQKQLYPNSSQVNRLWAIARDSEWSPKEVFAYMRDRFCEPDDIERLTLPQYEELCSTIRENRGGPPKNEGMGFR